MTHLVSNRYKTFGSKVTEKYDEIDPETVVKDPTGLDKILCRVGIDPRNVRIEIWQLREMGPDPEYTDRSDQIGVAEAALREFQQDNDTTGRSFKHMMDLVNGRYQSRGFENRGKADHSEAEYHLAGLLYGVFCKYADTETPERLVRAYITQACRENPYADDGAKRKWLRRGNNPHHTFKYRGGTVNRAIQGFARTVWERWRSTKDAWDTWTDDYGDIVYRTVHTAVQPLPDESYKTGEEVIEVAQMLNPERSKETHKTALRRLQSDHEQVKMAFCPNRPNGERYVYYPALEPDPDDARWVKLGGEKIVPE